MSAFTKTSFVALAAVVLLSSCGRPYATFQKTTPERFYTQTTVAPAAETPVTATSPVTDVPVVAEATPVAAASPVAELEKAEALVSTKAALSTNKKMSRHLARVKEMVAEARTEMAASSVAAGTGAKSVAPQKMNLVQRMVAKSIDKKIQHKMAPQKTMAKSLLSIGIIVALIGVLLLLIGTGTVYSLGYVGLVVGIILIIASLI